MPVKDRNTIILSCLDSASLKTAPHRDWIIRAGVVRVKLALIRPWWNAAAVE